MNLCVENKMRCVALTKNVSRGFVFAERKCRVFSFVQVGAERRTFQRCLCTAFALTHIGEPVLQSDEFCAVKWSPMYFLLPTSPTSRLNASGEPPCLRLHLCRKRPSRRPAGSRESCGDWQHLHRCQTMTSWAVAVRLLKGSASWSRPT